MDVLLSYLIISVLPAQRNVSGRGRGRCDDLPAIDIRNSYHRALIDQPGSRISWRFNRNGKPLCNFDTVSVTNHILLTDATDPARPETILVSLLRTPCHYGGTRPWFECPSCRGRCAKLYFRNGHFRCRKCHGLGYRSQLVARGDRPRLIAHRIRRSLGGSSSLFLPFPAKPPRMHWRTYDSIREKGARIEARAFAVLKARLKGSRRR
jgi:hypothetical protein